MHDLVRAVRHPKYLGFGLRPLSERRGLSTPPPSSGTLSSRFRVGNSSHN